MNKLFSDFPKVSKTEWEEKLIKELKGANFEESLIRKNEIEEIIFPTYHHKSDLLNSNEIPGNFPYTRGTKSSENNWNIASKVEVDDDLNANKKALDLLMSGSTALIFDLKREKVDCNVLFDSIGFEFIQTQLNVISAEQYTSLLTFFDSIEKKDILYRLDFIGSAELGQSFDEIARLSAGKNIRFCHVNTFDLQQCGANISQEIGFALSCGHEYMVKLVDLGYTINQAISSIHFSLGVGSDYFHEIAKIRAFRKLWSKIAKTYNSSEEIAIECHITAETGYMNKSLKDPYTNLLRQTTEAMSSISAGVDTLLINPYNAKSTSGISVLSERMATNISLILKEESYFDKVIDPVGGSYSIENLTEVFAEKSWNIFQDLDAKGGVFSSKAIDLLIDKVEEKARLRMDHIRSGKQMLIGVNKYLNPQNESNSWLEKESFLGMNKLIFERDI